MSCSQERGYVGRISLLLPVSLVTESNPRPMTALPSSSRQARAHPVTDSQHFFRSPSLLSSPSFPLPLRVFYKSITALITYSASLTLGRRTCTNLLTNSAYPLITY